MKKIFYRFLCAALCVMMAVVFAAPPVTAAAPGGEPCDHDWVEKSSRDHYNCQLGTCWVFYKECSKCGAQQQIAFREYDGFNLGQHNYVTTTRTSDCPYNPTIEERCSICNDTKITQGGHKWVQDGEPVPGKYCTDAATQAYKCADCGATKTERTGIRNAHVFEDVETTATCTEPGLHLKRCTKCGFETAQTIYQYPTGHKWVNGEDGDHTVGRVCSVCGTFSAGTEHTWSSWKSDSGDHWVECTQCGTKAQLGAHSYVNGKCTVCGKTKAICPHNWEVTGSFGVLNHNERCTLCGETRLVSCASSRTQPRTYCTDPTYCVCGNKVKDGQKNHNFGTWICHDSTHEHRCLNSGCQYGAVESHSFVTVAGTVKCSVCSFVDKERSVPHEHTFGTWTVGANNCVSRCTDPTCAAIKTTAHVLGAADCAGNAVCKNCGAIVKTTASRSHTGSTEIRGVVAAEVGKAGYTGDTYCLTCGKIISKGQTIPALTPAHEHEYVMKHDSTAHWTECSCGDRHDVAEHTYQNGACTVCGQKEPVSMAEHVHSFSATFATDSVSHWHVCTGCGEVTEKEEHLFVDDRCVSCGMTYEKYEVKEAREEAAADLVGGSNSVLRVFGDLSTASPNAYYALPIQRLYNAGVMKGVDKSTFGGTGSINRLQVEIILARISGQNDVYNSWSENKAAYMEWAAKHNITVPGNEEAAASRQETVYMIWVISGKPHSENNMSAFPDFDEVNDDYQMAVRWAVEKGILTGSDGKILPNDSIRRMDAATLFARYVDAENVVI